MRVYVAGPMRNKPKFNFPAFHEAAAKLRAGGHEVIDPAERDEMLYGAEAFNCPNGDEASLSRIGFDRRKALVEDMIYIAQCGAIAMLPGWEQSEGAQFEAAFARRLGLRFIYL